MPFLKLLNGYIAKLLKRKKQPKNPTIQRFKPGSLLVIAIVFLLFVMIFSVAIFTNVANFSRFSTDQTTKEQSVNLVEAGIDYTLWQLNQNPTYSGEVGKVFGENSFDITVIPLENGNKKITAIGYVPKFPFNKLKVKGQVEVAQENVQIPFSFGVHTGGPGTDVGSDYDVDFLPSTNGFVVIRGDVFAKGQINNEEQDPKKCRNTTPYNCKIYGEAYSTHGAGSPGISSRIQVIPGPGYLDMSPAEPRPTIDEAFWEAAAAAQGTTYCSSTPFTISNQNNYELKGKFVRSSGGTCGVEIKNSTVTVKGPIHITGNLNLIDSTVKLDDSFGSAGTVIMINGPFRISDALGGSGSQVLGTSASPRGYLLFYSTGVSINIPVIRQNKPHEAIYYGKNGEMRITGLSAPSPCNENDLPKITGAVLGSHQPGGIELKDCLEIVQDPNLSTTTFSAGPGGGGGAWQIVRGTYKFRR